MSTLKQSVAPQKLDPPKPIEAPKPPETKKQLPKEVEVSTTPAWVRPFVAGGACAVALVLFILFLIPSSPTTTTTVTTTTNVPPGEVVAQAEPVIESPTDDRPLPKLSPNLPATWYKPEATPRSAPVSTPARKAAAAPAPVPEAKFTPTPAYTPPARQRDWADEALSDSEPVSK